MSRTEVKQILSGAVPTELLGHDGSGNRSMSGIYDTCPM